MENVCPERRENSNYVELVIFTVVTILTILVGVLFSDVKKSTSPVIIGLSVCSSFLSAISVIGPAEMAFLGQNWILILLSYPFYSVFTIYFVVPKLHKKYLSLFTGC